jgi:hypothetical protein
MKCRKSLEDFGVLLAFLLKLLLYQRAYFSFRDSSSLDALIYSTSIAFESPYLILLIVITDYF